MLRADTLKSKLFSDPAWDILLDLMAADLAEQAVSVSSACAAAQVPFSTGLRYVNRLVRADLAVRFDDPNDKRRDLLRISDNGRAVMTDYVNMLWEKEKELNAGEQ
jgi:DNA-binding MarR family transcriptional regulator